MTGPSMLAMVPRIAAPLAIVAGFAAGAYVAHCARRPLARELEPFKSRYFAVAGMFGLVALMPSVLVMYGLFPDWTLMYLSNPAHLPGLLIVPFLALHTGLAPALGFLAVYRAQHARVSWGHKSIWFGAGGVALLLLLFGGGRLLTVAYYDGFHGGGRGLSLPRSALFLPLMLTTGAVVSVYVYAIMHTKRHVELGRGVPSTR